MHKCFKCGTEFEGKFCPECGTQWLETKNCPQCGAALAGSAKFCNNCGYSFVESAEAKRKKQPSKIGIFFKKVWAWIRAHLKVIIPTACSLVVAIVICSLIPTFIVMGVNGTYYAYSFDEKGEIVYSEKDYITLSSGKWKDSDGNKGTYSRSGKNVTLKYRDQSAEDFGDIMGDLGVEVPKEIKLKATVVNGVMTITDGVSEEIYVTKGHKHKYGEWEITVNPTCTEKGLQRHVCACKKAETEEVGIKHAEVKNGRCIACGQMQLSYYAIETSHGGIIGRLYDSYYVSGFAKGFSESENVEILAEYEGYPVTTIDREAFKDCKSLKSIKIPDSVTWIAEDAFKGCDKLIQTEKGVQYVDKWAIGCNRPRTNVTLRADTVGIAVKAFWGTSRLSRVKIPDSVIKINTGAFNGCDKLIQTEGGVQYVDKWVINCDEQATSVTLRQDTVGIGDFAFNGCHGLTSITIPNDVTSIGMYAFVGCDGLTSITIPNGVTNIENYAFSNCGGLTSITIPDGVTSIGACAFEDCDGLTSIAIPDSVTSIGMCTFYGCNKLTSIQFNGTKEQWNAIEKGYHWNSWTATYTIQCTDGKLPK